MKRQVSFQTSEPTPRPPSGPIQPSFFMQIVTSPFSKRIGMIMMFVGVISLAVVLNTLVMGGPLMLALQTTGLLYLAISSIFLIGLGIVPWLFKTASPTSSLQTKPSESSLTTSPSQSSMA